jgi:uncharacterized protein with HEPN domain
MRPDERDAAHLWDMREYARIVRRIVGTTDLSSYLADETTRLAVERALEIIGEAARRVSPEFQAAHPEIPWPRIISQRNVLAHDYDEIDQNLLWLTITQHIPELLARLESLVPDDASQQPGA